MHRQLRDLLDHLDAPEELAPGLFTASMGRGVTSFRIEVRDRAGRLTLRTVPTDFLPAPVAAHPLVKARLGRLGDILESGKLLVDAASHAILEVEVRPEDDVARILDALQLDCIRLRAAASGMAAATPHAAAELAAAAAAAALLEDLSDEALAPRAAEPFGGARAAPSRRASAPALSPLGTREARLSAGPPLEELPADLFAPGAPKPMGRPRARPADEGGGVTQFGGLGGGIGGGIEAGPARDVARTQETRRYDAPGRDPRSSAPAVGRGGLPAAPGPDETDEPATDSWGHRTQPKLELFAGRRARLIVIEGKGIGQSFALDYADAFCIGRSPHVDVRLDDQVVSRRNSLMQWEGEHLFIEDLGSYNGTRVNGTLQTRAELHPGDVIEVGWTKLRIEADGRASDQEGDATGARERRPRRA